MPGSSAAFDSGIFRPTVQAFGWNTRWKIEIPAAPYPAEFRQRTDELVRKGRRPEKLARQFYPSAPRLTASPRTSSGALDIPRRAFRL